MSVEIIDDNETTILHYACKCGCTEIVKLLLKEGSILECYATIVSTNDHYIHPLHYACFSGSYETVETIISFSFVIQINEVNDGGIIADK